MAKITMLVMSRNGDDRFEFDDAVPAEVTDAEKKFREITGLGYAAVAVGEGGAKSLMKGFDPNAKEIVFRAPLAGG
jgi:hypothetical protein